MNIKKIVGARLYIETKFENDKIKVGNTEIWINPNVDKGKHSATRGTIIAMAEGIKDLLIGDTVFFSYIHPINAIQHHEVFEEGKFFLYENDVELVIRDGNIIARDGKLIVGLDKEQITPPRDLMLPKGFELPSYLKTENWKPTVTHGTVLFSYDETLFPVGRKISFDKYCWSPFEYSLHEILFKGRNAVNVDAKGVHFVYTNEG